jgi:hypothetical protein
MVEWCTDINRCKITSWKERSKTELTGRSTLRRRRSALDCREKKKKTTKRKKKNKKKTTTTKRNKKKTKNKKKKNSNNKGQKPRSALGPTCSHIHRV